MATREAIFNLRVNTGDSGKAITDTTKELDKLDKSIDNVGQSSEQTAKDVMNLGARFEDIYGDIQPLSGRLGEMEDRMYELALAGKSNSEEFRALRAETIKFRNTILDVDAQVDAFADTGARMQGALQLSGGLVAGYQAFAGVTALLGEEQEKYVEVLVKLQSAQAAVASIEQVSQALNKRGALVVQTQAAATWLYTGAQKALAIATGTATGAMRLLRLALIATGLGAIVVGVGMLIANFDKLQMAVKSAANWFTNLGEKTKLVLSILFPVIGAIRLINYALEEMGIIESESTKQTKAAADERLKQITRQREARRQELRELIQQGDQRMKSIEDVYSHEIAKVQAAGKDTAKIEREKRAEMRKTLEEQIKNLEIAMQLNATNAQEMFKILKKAGDVRKQLLDIERKEELATISETTKGMAEASKKAEEIAKKELEQKEKLIERERLLRDYFIASIDDEGTRRIVQMQEQHKREREELIKKYGEDFELIKQLEAKQRNERAELEKTEIDKLQKEKLESEKANSERELANQKAQIEARLLMLKEGSEMERQAKLELWQLERDAQLENDKLTAGERELIEQQYQQKVRELNAETAKTNQELRLQEMQQAKEITEQGINAIASLTDGLFALRMRNLEKGSKEEEKVAKRQFQINKAFQLSTAIINGLQSILAITSVPDFTLGVNTAIRIASQLALNAGTIAKIAATQFNSTSAGSVQMGGGGSMNGVNANTPQQMNDRPEIETTDTGVQTPPPQQVYVLESDISATQERMKEIAVRSTF